MDTVTRLINAVAQRDSIQFPSRDDAQEYGQRYVLDFLREVLENNPVIDAYFEQRIALILEDIKTSISWEPK